MKFSILALGAAVAGISSQCAAQLHIESSFPTAPQARLISQQDNDGTYLPSESSANSDQSTYFAPTPPQAEITRDQVRDSQSILSDESTESQASNAQSADAQSSEAQYNDSVTPPGVPVKKRIAPGAPLHVLAMTPEVGMVPVTWNGSGCVTPNPIANYMTQSWCSNGLWDSYPCQRARQCACIQQQLFGHNRYTCGGCATCGTAGQVHGHHAGHRVGRPANAGCASCAATTSQCAQNSNTQNSNTSNSNANNTTAQSLMAGTTRSPLLGEFQVGLPVVDLEQNAIDNVSFPGNGQAPAQLTTAPAYNRLPNGQPLLQLPSDVPAIPQNAVAPAFPAPSVMPALPVPSATPVVASRPSASLR